MHGPTGILAPMIIKEVEEVGNRACRFVLVPKNKVELGCQVSFDELASGQHLDTCSWTGQAKGQIQAQ